MNVARKMNMMRALLVAGVLMRAVVCSAQQPDATVSDSASVERIRAALRQPVVVGGTTIVIAPKPHDFRWGVLTFVPPDTAGQIVAIRVPVGELVSHAARSFSAAQHRRAERAAHDAVAKALADVQNSQPK